MKSFLLIFLILNIISFSFTQEIIIDVRGYYKNDEIVMNNGNKLVHLSSKGNWNDNLNNYGRVFCKGSIMMNKDGKRSENELVLCEAEDVNGDFFWLVPKRSDSEWDAGVGKASIVSATGKYKNLLNKNCIYAVSYYKDTFHSRTECEK